MKLSRHFHTRWMLSLGVVVASEVVVAGAVVATVVVAELEGVKIKVQVKIRGQPLNTRTYRPQSRHSALIIIPTAEKHFIALTL